MQPTAETGLSISRLIGDASIPVKVIMLIRFMMFLTTLFITGKNTSSSCDCATKSNNSTAPSGRATTSKSSTPVTKNAIRKA